jgi:hypothetical protein
LLSSIECRLRAGNNIRAILTCLYGLAKPSPVAGSVASRRCNARSGSGGLPRLT